VPAIRPATPPPEFHLEKAVASIERIGELGATTLCPTHFGPVHGDVAETCSEAIAALHRWADWVQQARKETDELDAEAAIVERLARADLASRLDESQVARLEQTTSFWMNTWGYKRYFDKLEESSN
jgi:hypothetical protein